MNNHIRKAYEKGELVLLIGAGSSLTSLDQNGDKLLSSGAFSKIIAEEAGWQYSGEPLPSVYSAAKNVLGNGLNDLIARLYKHCKPSHEYLTIAKYTWPRIYTLNIDDALDKALVSNSPQKVNIRNRSDKVYDRDQLFNGLDYVKLNGSVDKIDVGLIFSQDEYGRASAMVPLWYRELAEDFFRYTFLFIGTKINEPVFYHQIARYRSETKSKERRSYVITPSATQIEKNNLMTLNLEHIPGSLGDFASWLTANFPIPLGPVDIAYNRNPALRELFSKATAKDKEKYASIFDDIVVVSRQYLKSYTEMADKQKIRSFYKGFKPDWTDILDDIPAKIGSTKKLYEKIKNLLENQINLFVVTGPAGSGKTTLLKQVALMLSENDGIPCYFLEKPTSKLRELIIELEKLNSSRFCIFYDRLDSHAVDLKHIIEDRHLQNGLFIGSESQRKWKNSSKENFVHLNLFQMQLSEIDKKDAELILNKIEQFGPWTRLSKMSKNERINELFVRSKRQLLIGLLESTYGVGFEKIIEREYHDIPKGDERTFVILVGLATMHRYYIKQEYVSRALAYLDIKFGIRSLVSKLSGIIYHDRGKLMARHPVYVRHLFYNLIEPMDVFPVLKSLLLAFTVYKAPVSKHIEKNELQLFKALTNHNFLKDLFRTKRDFVFKIYEAFEKHFENDGHFWLQYGLALRDVNDQYGAFEKLKTALLAFPNSGHIVHALAQQELIMACLCSSKEKAYDLLDSAKERLENQIQFLKDRENYAIVTLSEGHTSVINKFEDDAEAQKIAKFYANRISNIEGFRGHLRLKRAWSNLTKFATTGTLIENQNLLDECYIAD